MRRTAPFALAVCSLTLLAAVGARAESPPQTLRNDIGMTFALIPAGSFTMGRNPNFENGGREELPAHPVRIGEPFYMQTTEVTQEQWLAVMGSNPSNFKGRSNPVEQVSWDDIQVFLKALNDREGCGGCYRLPTEAEWEYAYRAGSTGTYYWGDEADASGQYAWYSQNSGGKTYPAGQLKPNAWGLYDMAGNVWEWVADCFHWSYEGAPGNGAAWTGGCYKQSDRESDGVMRRVLRGGSWIHSPSSCRAAHRNFLPPANRSYDYGFRVVRAVSARTP